jgi:hypothetical protein
MSLIVWAGNRLSWIEGLGAVVLTWNVAMARRKLAVWPRFFPWQLVKNAFHFISGVIANLK